MNAVVTRSHLTDRTYVALLAGEKGALAQQWQDDPEAQHVLHIPDVPTINMISEHPQRYRDLVWTLSTVTLTRLPPRFIWNPSTTTMLPTVPRLPLRYVELSVRPLPTFTCVGLDPQMVPILIRAQAAVVERDYITLDARMFRLITFHPNHLPPFNPNHRPPPPDDYRRPPPAAGPSGSSSLVM